VDDRLADTEVHHDVAGILHEIAGLGLGPVDAGGVLDLSAGLSDEFHARTSPRIGGDARAVEPDAGLAGVRAVRHSHLGHRGEDGELVADGRRRPRLDHLCLGVPELDRGVLSGLGAEPDERTMGGRIVGGLPPVVVVECLLGRGGDDRRHGVGGQGRRCRHGRVVGDCDGAEHGRCGDHDADQDGPQRSAEQRARCVGHRGPTGRRDV
jgi:hypothetical protein